MAARSREWRAAHPEVAKQDRERMALWRAEHPEEHKAQSRKWKKANRDKVKTWERRRLHHRRGLEGEAVNRDAVYSRDGGMCHLCGKQVPRAEMTLDHIVPLEVGGGYTYKNLSVAHRSCNSKRGAGRVPAQMRLV